MPLRPVSPPSRLPPLVTRPSTVALPYTVARAMPQFNIENVKGLVCGPLPLVATLGTFRNQNGDKVYFNHQDPKAWPSHSDVTYSFFDTGGDPSLLQEGLVKDAIAEYTRYANVTLVEVKGPAMIRISFDGTKGAWSAIGIDALKILEGPTMNLGFIPKTLPSRDDDEPNRKLLRSLTLHEFGHAFGLAHEWDGSRKLRSQGNYKKAIGQHWEAFENVATSNFPEPDETSIMNFFAPKDGSTPAITLTGGLSVKDKAWLTLMYPGKAASVGGDDDAGVLKSLNDLGVPLKTTSQILLSSTVSGMRFHYLEWISKEYGDKLGLQLIKDAIDDLKSKGVDSDDIGAEEMDFEEWCSEFVPPESHVLQGKITGVTPLVDHNNEDDLYDTVAAAVLNPQFHQVLANVVNQPEDGQLQDAQHFIGPILLPLLTTILPPLLGNILNGMPGGAQNSLSPYLVNGIPGGTAATMYQQPLPPHVQQGIFDIFKKVLTGPIGTGVIKGVLEGMAAQNEE